MAGGNPLEKISEKNSENISDNKSDNISETSSDNKSENNSKTSSDNKSEAKLDESSSSEVKVVKVVDSPPAIRVNNNQKLKELAIKSDKKNIEIIKNNSSTLSEQEKYFAII
jgi:hypothetical protein